MAARFVNIDRDTPLLLPSDLRQWIPADHLAHYILDAVETLPLSSVRVNERGTGDAQFPPRMMLGLLIYCYASGTFSSRGIERATYTDVAVRYLAGDTHPDHDTICEFRRRNGTLLAEGFVQVLEWARELKLLKVGQITLAVDGTKVLANASKHNAVSYQRAGEQIALLKQEVAQLLAKAEQADSTPLADGLSIPAEITPREERLAQLQAARAVIEERARQRAAEQRAAKQTEPTRHTSDDEQPPPPPATPKPKDQFNFTDPDSRIMKASNGDHFEQAYNAQAAVETDSRLIVAARTTASPNDQAQLVPTVSALPAPLWKQVKVVLADSGFYSAAAVATVEADNGPIVYAALEKKGHHRSVADLERRNDPPPPLDGATPAEHMRYRLRTRAGRELYRLRQQTIEPVFGIIKEVLGFRRFSLRGLVGAQLEWTLVCLAYNLRRLHQLSLPSH